MYWITTDPFLLVEAAKEQGDSGCPPRVWSYKVDSILGSTVSLREIVFGWDTVSESIQFYEMKP